MRQPSKSNKKQLSSQQRQELLRTLKARFEKNMNRHQGLEWSKVQTKLKLIIEKCGRSTKWKRLAVNRTLLFMIKRPVNIFFMTVQRRALKPVEVFATTAKRCSRGKKISRRIALRIWPSPWALSF